MKNRNKKHRILGLVLLIAALLLGIRPHAAAQPADPFPRTVIDAAGLPVTMRARPVVIAVLGAVPGLDRLVAPDDLRAIDPIQPPDHWTGIDLLITPTLYATAYPQIITAAGAEGVPVYQTGLITSLDGWRASVSALGQITGRDTRAADLLDRFEQRTHRLTARLAGRAPVRLLALTPEAYTFGAGTLFSDLVTLAGGTNLPTEAGYADFRQLDDSGVRALAPDLILLTPGWDAAGRAALLDLPGYASVPAIQTGRVVILPFDPTQPDDPGAALLVLAVLLHPAAFLP